MEENEHFFSFSVFIWQKNNQGKIVNKLVKFWWIVVNLTVDGEFQTSKLESVDKYKAISPPNKTDQKTKHIEMSNSHLRVRLSDNPLHKGIPGIQTTNPNHQVTIIAEIEPDMHIIWISSCSRSCDWMHGLQTTSFVRSVKVFDPNGHMQETNSLSMPQS